MYPPFRTLVATYENKKEREKLAQNIRWWAVAGGGELKDDPTLK
jgi:hypothetical protein